MKTLKIFIITGLILLPGLNLLAHNINYGIQGGYVFAIPHVKRYDNPKGTRLFYPMYSFNINGHIEYRLPGMLGVAAEPGFIRKGGSTGGINRIMHEVDIHLNYVQLPILTNLYFTDKFFISIGPEFAYLISNEENELVERGAFSPFEENAFEVSGLVGVNYSIAKWIDLGLRYNHSLTKYSEVTWKEFPYGTILGQSNAYNQYFHLICRFKIKTGANK